MSVPLAAASRAPEGVRYGRAALIGTGYIGGSLALALTHADLVGTWVGGDAGPEHLARARVLGFGLKSGDAVIENLDKVIVEGITLHAVIGRRIFETWHITKNLLESRDPNIHDLVWEVMLRRGEGTVVPFEGFEPAAFEEKIKVHPKVLFRL